MKDKNSIDKYLKQFKYEKSLRDEEDFISMILRNHDQTINELYNYLFLSPNMVIDIYKDNLKTNFDRFPKEIKRMKIKEVYMTNPSWLQDIEKCNIYHDFTLLQYLKLFIEDDNLSVSDKNEALKIAHKKLINPQFQNKTLLNFIEIQFNIPERNENEIRKNKI